MSCNKWRRCSASDRRACRSGHLLTVGRTPAAAPSAARGRVHSRTVAALAIDWPMGEPIDRSPSHEGSTTARADAGLCPRCGKHPPRPDRKTCQRCADDQRNRAATLRARRIARGLCVTCGGAAGGHGRSPGFEQQAVIPRCRVHHPACRERGALRLWIRSQRAFGTASPRHPCVCVVGETDRQCGHGSVLGIICRVDGRRGRTNRQGAPGGERDRGAHAWAMPGSCIRYR